MASMHNNTILCTSRKVWINRLRVAVSAQREPSSLVEGNRMCCGCENVTQREGVGSSSRSQLESKILTYFRSLAKVAICKSEELRSLLFLSLSMVSGKPAMAAGLAGHFSTHAALSFSISRHI